MVRARRARGLGAGVGAVLVAVVAGALSRADADHRPAAGPQADLVAGSNSPAAPGPPPEHRPSTHPTADLAARLPQVPECAAGCDPVFALDLPGGALLAGLQTTAAASPPVALLGYWVNGSLRAAQPVHGKDGLPYEQVIGGVCGTDGTAQRCVVSFAFGIQGRAVAAVLADPAGGITVTDAVEGEASDPVLADLNGDGRTDAVLRRSTYEPDFASGPRYWETWVESGGTFSRTGCTEPVAGDQPVPTGPATGPCRA